MEHVALLGCQGAPLRVYFGGFKGFRVLGFKVLGFRVLGACSASWLVRDSHSHGLNLA